MATGLLNYTQLSDVVDHVVEMEKQIARDVASILQQSFPAVAYPYMRFTNAEYPKWLNGFTNAKPDAFGISEEYDLMTLLIELQIGKITQGFDGKLEQTLYTWIPYTLAAFRTAPRLQTTAKPVAPVGLLESSLRLADEQAPGDVLAARFILTLAMYVHNTERDIYDGVG